MIKIKDLHVYYGLIEAVKGIDFEVKEGEIKPFDWLQWCGKAQR